MDSKLTDRRRDRRRARRRHAIEEHGIRAARVRPGHDAHVIDISAEGALVETTYRLLPGAGVDLQLETPARRILVRGRVVRCAVAAICAAGVLYRGAIVFDRTLAWLGEDGGVKPLPPDASVARAMTTHRPG